LYIRFISYVGILRRYSRSSNFYDKQALIVIFADVVENPMTELEDLVCLLKDLSVVNEVRVRFDSQLVTD